MMIPKVVVGELTVSGWGKFAPWRFATLGPFERGEKVELPARLARKLERQGIIKVVGRSTE